MSSPFPPASACPCESCKESKLKHVMQKTCALVCVHHMPFMPSRTCMRCYIDTQRRPNLSEVVRFCAREPQHRHTASSGTP